MIKVVFGVLLASASLYYWLFVRGRKTALDGKKEELKEVKMKGKVLDVREDIVLEEGINLERENLIKKEEEENVRRK